MHFTLIPCSGSTYQVSHSVEVEVGVCGCEAKLLFCLCFDLDCTEFPSWA